MRGDGGSLGAESDGAGLDAVSAALRASGGIAFVHLRGERHGPVLEEGRDDESTEAEEEVDLYGLDGDGFGVVKGDEIGDL